MPPIAYVEEPHTHTQRRSHVNNLTCITNRTKWVTVGPKQSKTSVRSEKLFKTFRSTADVAAAFLWLSPHHKTYNGLSLFFFQFLIVVVVVRALISSSIWWWISLSLSLALCSFSCYLSLVSRSHIETARNFTFFSTIFHFSLSLFLWFLFIFFI